MTNRNPVKQLFITFPHSIVDKLTFRDSLLRFEPDFYKICEEKHKDGSPHLHAVIRFKNKYSKPFVIKWFKEIYPDDYKRIHVKPVRSIKHALAYLSKEDPEPLSSGEFKSNRNPLKNIIANLNLSFANLYGYKDVESFQLAGRERQALIKRHQDEIHPAYMYWMNAMPRHSLSSRSQEIFDSLFSAIPILKEDITFLREELCLSPELA